MPRTARPTPETLHLRVTSPPSASERTARLATVPLVPWPLAAAVGGVVAALLGWLLVVGVAGVAWFTASAIPLPDVLLFCSQVWLLAHGGGAQIAGTTITLVPLGLTLVGGRWVAELLYDTSPREPMVLAAVAAGLLMVAALASLLPARRAARVSPMVALRAE